MTPACAPVPRVAFVAVGTPTFDLAFGDELAASALAALRTFTDVVRAGAAVVTDPAAVPDLVAGFVEEAPDIVLVAQATFTTSGLTRPFADVGVPVVSWSFPEARTGDRLRSNSLCGAMLAHHAWAETGVERRWLHVLPADRRTPERLVAAIQGPWPRATPADTPAAPLADEAVAKRASAALARIRGRRIGMIGDPPAGMGPCADDGRVARALGCSVDRIPIDAWFAGADRLTPDEVDTARATAETTLDGLGTLDRDGVTRGLRLHGALTTLLEERRWDAAAVQCWPDCFTHYGAAPCAALGAVADTGRPASCEADLPGATTSLLLQELTDRPPFLADLVDLDERTDTAVLWHCGAGPPSLAAHGARAGRHPNRAVPLTQEFTLAPGPVTLARLGLVRRPGAEPTLRLVVGTAEVLDTRPAFRGTSAVIRLPLPAGSLLDLVLGEAIDHHLAVVPGDVAAELTAVADELGVPLRRW